MDSLGMAAAQMQLRGFKQGVPSTSTALAAAPRPAVARVEKLHGAAAVQALPLRVRQAAGYIGGQQRDDPAKSTNDGIWTRVLIHDYADAILVIVSQLGKVGCLTQVTMNRRPSHYSGASQLKSSLDADLDGSDGLERRTDGDNDTHDDDDFAALLSTCTQQRLLGSHAPGQRALYALYNASIAARASTVMARGEAREAGEMLRDKTVIVGLALAPAARNAKQGAEESGGGGTDDGDDDDDDFATLAVTETQRFRGILDLVLQARHPSELQ